MKAGSQLRMHPGKQLWPSVWMLLRLRGQIWIGEFRRGSLKRKIGLVVLGLLVLAGLVFIFILSWMLLRFLRSPELIEIVGDPTLLLNSVPVVIVYAAFFGILLTSFGVLLQALYLAGDMDFLLSAPVPIRAVFITKLLQAILPSFGLILLFSLPVLYGLGVSQGYRAIYFPAVLVLLIALALAAAGLSSLLVLIIVRIFPARRVAEVLGFFVAVMSLLCSQSGQFANWTDISQEQTAQVVGQFSRLNTPWSPLAWAGRGLVEIGEGRWLIGSGLLIMIVGLASAIFLVALSTSERLYYTGWANINISRRKKRDQVRTPRRVYKRLLYFDSIKHLVPAPVRGIVAKDFIVIRRDLRNLSQLIMPLILGVIYAIMLLRSGGQPPAGRGEAPEWFMEIMKSVMIYGNVGIALFVSWFLISRLAMMGFSQEGKNYWLLKSAPVSATKLLSAKFLVAYIPALILGWGFLLIISVIQGASLFTLLYSSVVIALIVAGVDGLNLAFGVAGANLEWDDPRKMTSGSVGCLGTLVSMVYLAVSLGLFFGPLVIFGLLRWPQLIGQTLGLALGGAFSLIFAFLPPWLVRKQVPYIGEVKSK